MRDHKTEAKSVGMDTFFFIYSRTFGSSAKK